MTRLVLKGSSNSSICKEGPDGNEDLLEENPEHTIDQHLESVDIQNPSIPIDSEDEEG